MNVRELLSRGVIRRGENAKNNPEFSGLSRFALGIANKDYPAQTPGLWNTVYAQLGMTERNVRTFGKVEDAQEIFAAFKNDPDYIGGDVGVGFKDRVLGFLDEIDPLAEKMGAINVVAKTARGLTGYNTDGEGFAKSLADVFADRDQELLGKNIMLLGAGGTTNAIAFALANRGARLVILNRTEEKASRLAKNVNEYFARQVAISGPRSAIAKYLGLVDAVVSAIDDPHSELEKFSAVGEIALPASEESIRANLDSARRLLASASKRLVVADVMLRQNETATIRTAKEAGLTTLDGMPMVFNQAVEAFYLVNRDQLDQLGIGKPGVASIMKKVFA